MEVTKAEVLHWEISEEPDDWQKKQYEVWKRDQNLRLKFLDFYSFLGERRYQEVQEQKKRAVQQNHVSAKEVPMSTSTPTSEEQREAMELIKEWNTNARLQSMYRTFDRFLAAIEPDEERERREASRQQARAARLNNVVRKTEARPLTEREQVYLERVHAT